MHQTKQQSLYSLVVKADFLLRGVLLNSREYFYRCLGQIIVFRNTVLHSILKLLIIISFSGGRQKYMLKNVVYCISVLYFLPSPFTVYDYQLLALEASKVAYIFFVSFILLLPVLLGFWAVGEPACSVTQDLQPCQSGRVRKLLVLFSQPKSHFLTLPGRKQNCSFKSYETEMPISLQKIPKSTAHVHHTSQHM